MVRRTRKTEDDHQKALPFPEITIGDTSPEGPYFNYDSGGNMRIPESFDRKNLFDPCWGMSYCGPGVGQAVIVGKNETMLDLYNLTVKVADDSCVSVLIQGETGTGKGLFARGVGVRAKLFVPRNCAAFPESLLESELFGHVKGAFTGALCDRKGIFEYADGDQVFLDELDSMPLNVQAALLCVVQDHVVTPVGSNKSIPVNVRLISASKKNLKSLVNDGNFREDLFYRINVVRLELPPLRNRKEDIPILVAYFLLKCRPLHKRNIKTIPRETLDVLSTYTWPGNIRELENNIDRVLVIGDGLILKPEEFNVLFQADLTDQPNQYLCSSEIYKKPYGHNGMKKRIEDFRAILEQNPGLSTQQLARMVGCHHRTIERYLVELGDLAILQKDPNDSRHICYSFTAERARTN